ncbi:hypothetical protein HDU76_011421, partial [Blyttiomyces sp. JEL0837]
DHSVNNRTDFNISSTPSSNLPQSINRHHNSTNSLYPRPRGPLRPRQNFLPNSPTTSRRSSTPTSPNHQPPPLPNNNSYSRHPRRSSRRKIKTLTTNGNATNRSSVAKPLTVVNPSITTYMDNTN